MTTAAQPPDQRGLAGLRVVEIGEMVSAPWAAKLIGDLGADVIKVEPEGGDRARRLGPFPDGSNDPETGALHLHLNTNKRSAVVDLERSADRDLVRGLVAGSDAVIESARPGALARHGLGYDALRSLRLGGEYYY